MPGKKPTRNSKSAAASGAAGHAAASGSARDAAESHSKIVILRVLDKLKTRKNPDLKNMAIEQARINIINNQVLIDTEVSNIGRYELAIETIILSGLKEEDMLDQIHYAKKNIVASENNLKHLMSIQELI